MSSRKQMMLSADEESALFEALQSGRDPRARDRLAIHYRPLAVSRAMDFSRRTGMPVDDLVQEAMVALMVAIDKFEVGRGARLSTFATFHIHSALVRYLMDNQGPTRVGTNVKDKKIFSNLRRMVAEHEAKTGRPVDDAGYARIAERLGVPIEAVRRMENRVFARDLSIDARPPSEDGPSNNWLDREIGEEDAPRGLEARLDQTRLMAEIREILPTIATGRNLEILKRRIAGFEGPDEYRALGEEHDISGERVRQIQRQGLKRLREALMARGFRSFDDVTAAEA